MTQPKVEKGFWKERPSKEAYFLLRFLKQNICSKVTNNCHKWCYKWSETLLIKIQNADMCLGVFPNIKYHNIRHNLWGEVCGPEIRRRMISKNEASKIILQCPMQYMNFTFDQQILVNISLIQNGCSLTVSTNMCTGLNNC